MQTVDNDLDRFTTGDCHILAQEIHSLTRLPLVAFADSWGRPTCHVGILKDKDVLDIEGLTDLQWWTQIWSNDALEDTGQNIVKIFSPEDFNNWQASYRDSKQRSKIIAKQLVSEYLSEKF
jgi:hypothetical protein